MEDSGQLDPKNWIKLMRICALNVSEQSVSGAKHSLKIQINNNNTVRLCYEACHNKVGFGQANLSILGFTYQKEITRKRSLRLDQGKGKSMLPSETGKKNIPLRLVNLKTYIVVSC